MCLYRVHKQIRLNFLSFITAYQPSSIDILVSYHANELSNYLATSILHIHAIKLLLATTLVNSHSVCSVIIIYMIILTKGTGIH